MFLAVMGLLALWTLVAMAAWLILWPRIAPAPTVSPPVDSGADLRFEVLEGRMDRLTLAVSDGIGRAERVEKRIQKTVTSARRLVSEAGLEHAGIEAEHEQLHLGNDPVVEPLPAVSAPVARHRQIRVPGGFIALEESNGQRA